MSDIKITYEKEILAVLERIARAQEGVLAIAAEARVERNKLADQMKQRLQAGFSQEKPGA